MLIYNFLQQFLGGRAPNGLMSEFRLNCRERNRRNRSSEKAIHIEACEARTLLAAAMTSSMNSSPDDANAELAAADSGGGKVSKFIIFDRWFRTATNGSGLKQGDPTTLTWSLPADGVTTDPFTNPNAPNNLRAFLDTNFPGGSGNDLTQRPWFHIFDKSLNRLEELSGLTYNYITQDDGVPMTFNNMGILGQRADVRIMGKNLDNPFNTLAYNAFPDDGDMTIDTSEVEYFTNGENDFRAFRNVLMHEFMHGLGVDHMESSNADILMEPSANNSFDGPQLDDILALQRSYGDALEKRGGNTAATAIELLNLSEFGSYSAGRFGDSLSVSPEQTDFVSIDDETDQDFYKFTIEDVGSVTITLSPRGTTYMVGPQNTPGGPVVPQTSFNSKNQSDLTLKLLGEDGVTVLQTRNAGGLGVNEVIQNFQLTSPGTYYIQVTGANTDKIQLYGLNMTYSRAPGNHFYGTIFNDVDRDNVFDSGETGVPNIRAYIDTNSNRRFDTGEPSGFSGADGFYAITGAPSGGIALRIELPPNRQSTLPPDWNDTIVWWIPGGFGSSVPDNNFGSFALPVGTTGNDAFVLTYSPNNVTITLSTNGGAATTIGTFPLTSPLTVDGAGGTDSVRIVGNSGVDEFRVASANSVLRNGHQITLTSIEQRTLAGAAGNDKYIFDTDAALGRFTLDESGGGLDLLDFFLSDRAVNINLAQSTSQVVNTNLNLTLGSASTFENVIGSFGNDTIIGNALANNLNGGPGNDTLNGVSGSDTLIGSHGDDTYSFGASTAAGNSIISEVGTTGVDTINFSSITSPTLGVSINLGLTTFQRLDALRFLRIDGASAFENVIGGAGNDTITGNALANTLNGGPGNDTLNGVSGSDTLVGGNGNDTYSFMAATAAGNNVISEVGTTGVDTINFSSITSTAIGVSINLGLTTFQRFDALRFVRLDGASAIENVTGGSGNDTITGNALANNLNGGPGNDTLNGVSGSDTLIGGQGNDTYSFMAATVAGNNVISEVGTGGVDTINFSSITSPTGGVSINLGLTAFQRLDALRFVRIDGAFAFENVIGGSGNDTITGNALANTLNGGPGNDRLTGEAGNDLVGGGTGDDTYVFGAASNMEIDTINEAASAGIDTLDFSAVTTDLMLSLESSARQSVHTNRTITLQSATVLENVIGGSGNDVLIGNIHANRLTGNNGRDILVGHEGSDFLSGGNDDDILVSGVVNIVAMSTSTITFSEFYSTLRQSWTGTLAYPDRVQRIHYPQSPAPGKVVYLLPVDTPVLPTVIPRNAFDDGQRDELSGNAGLDLFFAGALDAVLDRASGEVLDAITTV